MIEHLRGIAGVVHVVRHTLGVVALVFTLLAVVFMVALFAPIPSTAKYVIGGIVALMVSGVWLQF